MDLLPLSSNLAYLQVSTTDTLQNIEFEIIEFGFVWSFTFHFFLILGYSSISRKGCSIFLTKLARPVLWHVEPNELRIVMWVMPDLGQFWPTYEIDHWWLALKCEDTQRSVNTQLHLRKFQNSENRKLKHVQQQYDSTTLRGHFTKLKHISCLV